MNIAIRLITILTLSSPTFSWAEPQDYKHNQQGAQQSVQAQEASDKTCGAIINAKVNGLVCDFCARALEKVFGKRDEVSGINVDLAAGNISITMKSGQTMEDATLTQLIMNAGYNVVAIDKGC